MDRSQGGVCTVCALSRSCRCNMWSEGTEGEATEYILVFFPKMTYRSGDVLNENLLDFPST